MVAATHVGRLTVSTTRYVRAGPPRCCEVVPVVAAPLVVTPVVDRVVPEPVFVL
jgi:hypothetical protein